MKEVERRLIVELMKNSRRSDRELARAIGCSQPTVSRMIKRLEKKGVIKEYTMIPDFQKLGYAIMGATLLGLRENLDEPTLAEVRRKTAEVERSHPHASLIAVNGQDQTKNRLFITFYEDYSAYKEAMRIARSLPYVKVESMETFLVDLNDKANYRVLSMAPIAEHLLKREREANHVRP
jgi:DNA-binding Lrp family transcriptional regulator